MALLNAKGFREPDPDPLSLSVPRFPLLGDLFGYRRIVKGGWKIAEWKYDREKPSHTVHLLADGRYCWNGEIVSLSQFADWHESPYVGQGPPLMVEGLSELKAEMSLVWQ